MPEPLNLLILATYNERDNIGALIDTLLALTPRLGLIVVDDASPDGTADVVRAAMAREPGRIELIERAGKLGYGSAFVAGFRAALARDPRAVVTMDADWSHDPQAVPALLAALEGADLAIGSRYIGGIRILNWSMSRLLLSTGANAYLRTILRFGARDCTSGFRAYRAATLRAIDLDRASSRGYAFLVEILEMVTRRGLRVAEVPIVYTERKEGRSKMSHGVILEAVARPWLLLAERLLGRGRG